MTLFMSTFTGFYSRILEKMKGTICLNALYHWSIPAFYTGIIKITSELTWKFQLILLQNTQESLCQLSLDLTVEFGRKWMPKSVTMHYSTPSHLDRHYSNSFRVNKKIGMNSSSGQPRLCLCQLSWNCTVEFGRKWMPKPVTMHYSTDQFLTFMQSLF